MGEQLLVQTQTQSLPPLGAGVQEPPGNAGGGG